MFCFITLAANTFYILQTFRSVLVFCNSKQLLKELVLCSIIRLIKVRAQLKLLFFKYENYGLNSR